MTPSVAAPGDTNPSDASVNFCSSGRKPRSNIPTLLKYLSLKYNQVAKQTPWVWPSNYILGVQLYNIHSKNTRKPQTSIRLRHCQGWDHSWTLTQSSRWTLQGHQGKPGDDQKVREREPWRRRSEITEITLSDMEKKIMLCGGILWAAYVFLVQRQRRRKQRTTRCYSVC